MDTETTSEEREFHFDAGTLVGDLRDAMLAELKDVADGNPWNERPEAQQRAVVDRIHSAARGMVDKTVLLISDNGFKSLMGELVQVAVKDGYKAVVEIPRGAEFRHDLMDRQGKEVVLVLAEANEYRGTRGAVPITPPAPLLDYAKEAAKVAQQAEEGVVWWSAASPELTYLDVDEVLNVAGIMHLQPHEIGRTGWLAPRWAVLLPAVGGAEVQYFDSEDDAAAFCAEAAIVVEASPAPVEEAPVPVPDVQETRDDGFVPDLPGTVLEALPKELARFTPHMVTDGAAIFYCWKLTDGTVRCHEDSEIAATIAARMKAESGAQDDDDWDTAEDRERKRLAAGAVARNRTRRGAGEAAS